MARKYIIHPKEEENPVQSREEIGRRRDKTKKEDSTASFSNETSHGQ
jgi:hypothetical protein